MSITVFKNVNQTADDLMFNIMEFMRKSDMEKYPKSMSSNTNKSISQGLPFLLVRYERSFHCTLTTC